MALIDKEATLEMLDRMRHDAMAMGEKSTIYKVRQKVKRLPTVEPMQWIPCGKRLPKDGQNVLVTYKTTDKIHPCQYHDDGSRNPWYSYIDNCRVHSNVVIAWMPLPAPYKEET